MDDDIADEAYEEEQTPALLDGDVDERNDDEGTEQQEFRRKEAKRIADYITGFWLLRRFEFPPATRELL
jgi:predicted  nucleic acid-binding Zn-ribbon protein